jgi:CheY-like chemotaxis protein
MKKILVIDDYADVAEMIAANLETQLPDLEVVTASDGILGFGKCCLEKYDLIITDYKMPGVNGAKAAKFIKEDENSKNRDTPFIMISAFVPQIEEKGIESFATHVIQKPFQFGTLVELVKKVLVEEERAA